MRARDFYTELPPEILLEENTNVLMIYLRNIPTIGDADAYLRQVIAHFKLNEEERKSVRMEILRTEICGEKTENRDGAIQITLVHGATLPWRKSRVRVRPHERRGG